MKTRGWLVAVIISFAHASASAQCSGTVRTVSYDTTVSGIGTTGGIPFNFTFPQFDGMLGTLLDVQLTSRVTLTFNYDIENNLNSAQNHRLRIERYDEITSSVLSSPLEMSYVTPWRNHNLAASNGITGSGPDFMSFSPFYLVNDYTIIDQTYYNTADFLGAGTVSFDYNTYMYRTTNPATGATINNDASFDQITFSVSYNYCDNIMLAPGARPVRPNQNTETQSRLFPNPTQNGKFSIRFDNSKRGDWQVEIFNTGGRLVSRQQFFNTLTAKLNENPLAKGIYLIKATNTKSRVAFIERLIVK